MWKKKINGKEKWLQFLLSYLIIVQLLAYLNKISKGNLSKNITYKVVIILITGVLS